MKDGLSEDAFAALLGQAQMLAPPVSRRKAIVFGNNYPGELSELESCVNDANAIAAALTACGWAVTTLVNVDLAQMKRALRAFRDDTLDDGDDAVFYFSGHGVTFDGSSFCIPCRMNTIRREKDIIAEALCVNDVMEDVIDGVGAGGEHEEEDVGRGND